MHGKIRITSIKDGKETYRSNWYPNRVVDSGLTKLIDAITNGTAVQIDSGEIGDDDTPVSASDTNLGNAVFTGALVEKRAQSGKTVTFSFFFTDNQLADGDYKEFGMRIGTTLFSRVLFNSTYTKATGVNTRIDYQVTASAVV